MIRLIIVILFLLATSSIDAQGPILVGDFNSSGDAFNPSNYKGAVYKDALYLPINNGNLGEEVGVIQEGQIQLFKDINPGFESSHPRNFVVFKDKLYFTAHDDINKGALWESDGTPEGTKVIFAPKTSAIARPNGLILSNNGKLFLTYESQLHSYDGNRIKDLNLYVNFINDFQTTGPNYCKYRDEIAFIKVENEDVYLYTTEDGIPIQRAHLATNSRLGKAYDIAQVEEGIVFGYSKDINNPFEVNEFNGTYVWQASTGQFDKLKNGNSDILFSRIVGVNESNAIGVLPTKGIYAINGGQSNFRLLTSDNPDIAFDKSWNQFNNGDAITFLTKTEDPPLSNKVMLYKGDESGANSVFTSDLVGISNFIPSRGRLYFASGISEGNLITFHQIDPIDNSIGELSKSNLYSNSDNAVLMLGEVRYKLYFAADFSEESIGRELYYIQLPVPDYDADGYDELVDCDDRNPDINPSSEEIANNDIDENCDGQKIIIDNDRDGFNSDEDCDDNNAAINPLALEKPSNGIDEDCNGEDATPYALSVANYTVHIYPNPAVDILNVNLYDGTGEINVRCYDASGHLLLDRLLIQRNTIDIDDWQEGVYIIEVLHIDSRKRVFQKLVKTR